jgi:dihydroxycyclohexadiene carboxylate dehydrogenase
MPNRFKNKVAVITGAAQGIGRVAEKMAKEKGVLARRPLRARA